jgi:hypothetical protein
VTVVRWSWPAGRGPRGVWWGPHGESGVWLATRPRRRLMWRDHPAGHDCVFVALWRLRLRVLVRPW